MKQFIYITFIASGWQKNWFIVADHNGNAFTNIKEAQKFARTNYPDVYWGLAEYGQMILNNAQIDNF